MFLIGGAITAIVAIRVVAKNWEARPFDATGFALLFFTVAFPAVHFGGYACSRALAGVAGLLHAVCGVLLVSGAVYGLTSRRDGALAGFFLLWAAFHLTLAVLMLKLRVLRRSQTPQQATRAAFNDMAKSEAKLRRPRWVWRGYIIYSTFHNELAYSTGKWQHWPVIRLLFFMGGWVPYLGWMVVVMAISLLPSVVLGSWFRLGPPDVAYWVFATLAILGSALLLFWTCRTVLRQWRQKIVYVESLAYFVGANFGLLGAVGYFTQGSARFFG